MKEQNKFTEHLHAYTLAHPNSCTHARLHTYTHTHLHALTLIELVIVCAIIAVLVGIVWVVMAPAREKARQAVCISNLTQIGHAFRMYRDDWDGVEPQKGMQLEYWELGLPDRWSVAEALYPYLKSEEVFRCPSCFLTPGGCPPRPASTYTTNYCVGGEYVEFGLPYNACAPFGSLNAAPFFTFPEIVAQIPDWPILLCSAHHYFYFPTHIAWGQRLYFGITLPNFTFRRFYSDEYWERLTPPRLLRPWR